MKNEQLLKTLFLAGFKCCEGGWNIQKAETWFDKTYEAKEFIEEQKTIKKEDFFIWLKENGQLDKYEAALDMSEDFTINQEIRIKACNDINLLFSEYKLFIEERLGIAEIKSQAEEQKSIIAKEDPSFTENINRTIISQLEQKILELIKDSKEKENQFIKFAESLYEVVQKQAKPINKLVNPMRVEGFEAGGNYVIEVLKDYLYNKTSG